MDHLYFGEQQRRHRSAPATATARGNAARRPSPRSRPNEARRSILPACPGVISLLSGRERGKIDLGRSERLLGLNRRINYNEMLIPYGNRAGSAGPDLGCCRPLRLPCRHDGNESQWAAPGCHGALPVCVGDHGLRPLLLLQPATAGENIKWSQPTHLRQTNLPA
jgi:hypothetical protein